MTCEPVGWGWPGASEPWGGASVARALERADEAVAAALRGLAAADDVVWVSAAATRYRAVLAEGTDGLRAACAVLAAALSVAVEHDAAAELARQTSQRDLWTRMLSGALAEPSTVGGPLGPGAW